MYEIKITVYQKGNSGAWEDMAIFDGEQKIKPSKLLSADARP